ncbi:30S ribosome-binding factor RbfA [uncultured Lamprocystis sp.]|jgi:ribosome-binding factor A|uniref:30S ribosome-binding factor RbfA n=1 Tax=uncultured Lamprocystis sp. TaxID=543132 RepID=UPI0025FB47C4|nr:30S ribosome-binding factor RbfA [uncultured Lamprocystis sp.]
MKEFDRTERIGSELKRELYQVLRDEVRDPRLGNITVQEVRVVRDLSHAKVFFTCFGGEEDAEEQARLLNGRLSGFVRHALAQRVRLRIMPQLHFVYDASILAGEHLSHLIDVAVQGTGAPTDESPDETDDAADASSPASSAEEREQPQ